MITSDQNTAAIILSGGAGTRFNGVDKGLQRYNGKALVEHVIAIIEPQVNELYLCANRNLGDYRALGFKVHSDQQQSYQGPIAGISSALKGSILSSNAQQLLISSCDVPYLPSNIKERLQLSLIADSAFDVSVAHDGSRRQNLHCLIKRRVWHSLIDFFDDGGRAMYRWFDQVNTIDSDFSDDASSFLNINTVEQLSAN